MESYNTLLLLSSDNILRVKIIYNYHVIVILLSCDEIIITIFFQIQDIDGIHGVTLVSPSATTFGDINPSFRIYYMDKTSYELIDYEQYHLDIQKANGYYIIITNYMFFVLL